MLREQFTLSRVRTVLNNMVALGPSQTGCNQLFPVRGIQVYRLFITVPTVPYAFRGRFRAAFPFRCSRSSFFTQAVGALLLIFHAAEQAETRKQNAHQCETETRE